MRTRSSVRGRALAFVAVATLVGALPVGAAEEKAGPPAEGAVTDEPTARADCCFNNRAFSGVCVVTPEEDETCTTILAYLNNPQSQGKDYCGKTTIRGGWQQTTCEAPQSGGPVESPRR
jgi:hypothetical protein